MLLGQLGEIRYNKMKEDSCKVLKVFLLTFSFSKQVLSGPWFGNNIKILMEDKGKAEDKIKIEKPKSNIIIMSEITSGCVKNQENKFKMMQ